uniref:Uncharacterized protein n=1 Tax=Mesocestoides corti TaxID=53468 RepID=A0A5K3FV47_MESCO
MGDSCVLIKTRSAFRHKRALRCPPTTVPKWQYSAQLARMTRNSLFRRLEVVVNRVDSRQVTNPVVAASNTRPYSSRRVSQSREAAGSSTPLHVPPTPPAFVK